MQLRILVLLLAALAIASCTTEGPALDSAPHEKTVKNFIVEFTPNTQSKVLDVATSGGANGCNHANPGKGCIKFDKGKLGTITFRLSGHDRGKQCGPSPSDAKWVITDVLLSAYPGPGTDKGTFDGTLQPQWLQDAFFIENPPDLEHGFLYRSDKSSAPGEVEFVNLNNNDPAQGEKVAYYRVTATSCASPHTSLVADPTIRNTGGGS
ncbi:MAG: hypothetical protein ACREO9_05590 [Lysobacterales bacterium]